jgi:hypothetical protein
MIGSKVTAALGLAVSASTIFVASCKSRSEDPGVSNETNAVSVVQDGTVCAVETASSIQDIYKSAKDPFKEKVLKAPGCKEQMAKKDPYTIDTFMQQSAKCKLGKRFIVSEKGQLAVSKETGTDPRTVDEWDCGPGQATADEDADLVGKVFVSGPGSAMHIIAWDAVNKTFNFYSADHPSSAAQIFFHGNSHTQAVTVKNDFRHPCTNCHTGGALLMKEIRFPWPFWHSPVAQLPGVVTNPKWKRATDANHKVEIAELFEVLTLKSLAMANQSHVNKIRQGSAIGSPKPESPATASVKYRDLLFPLFCERGIGLASSPSKYGSGNLGVPADLVLNRLLVPRGSKISLTAGIKPAAKGTSSRLDMTGFEDNEDFAGVATNAAIATVGEAQWKTTAASFFSIKDLPPPRNPDGDVFPMLIPARHFADDDLVSRLVNEGVIPESFAANVLLVDLQNPVFSDQRCGLLSKVPADLVVTNSNLSAAGTAMVTAFEAAIDADPTAATAGSAASKYKAAKAMTPEAKATFVTNFATACKTSLKDSTNVAKAMAIRWRGYKAPAPGLAATTVRGGSDGFNRAIETFVENAVVPQVKATVALKGITQGCAMP